MVGVAQKIMSLNYDDIRPPCFNCYFHCSKRWTVNL